MDAQSTTGTTAVMYAASAGRLDAVVTLILEGEPNEGRC